jgi:hypothetical protein
MQKSLRYLAIFSLVLASCSDETTIYEDPSESLILEENQTVLTNSVNFDNSGVLDIYQDEAAKLASKNSSVDADSYPLALVANIEAPSYSSAEELAATHVAMDGNYLYVSYNTAGETYAGGVDVIDISDIVQPRLTSRLYYTNADINSIAYENGHVYVVGGVDSEQSVTATANSFIGKIPVSNGRLSISGGISYGFQDGLVANDLVVNASGLFVSSGVNGFVTQYDKNTLEVVKEVAYDDLRSIIQIENDFAVLDASYGVRFLDNSLSETGGFAVANGDFREADKRTISYYGDKISIAEGSNGAGIYNAETGAFEKHLPIVLNPDDATQDEVVTNAVSFNEDVFLMANGGAGLALSENEDDLNLVGVIELRGSINYVLSKDDYIIAASGKSGIQIIKMNRPSQSLEEACSSAQRYNGSSYLDVESYQTLGYSGSKNFRELSVSGELLLCGSWSVRDEFVVEEDGTLEIKGSIYMGRNNRRRNIEVSSGATLRVEGVMVIYGDIILEENASLEFLGDANNVYVLGDVIIADGASVTGNFNDRMNKF